jgi:cell division protease FtsH
MPRGAGNVFHRATEIAHMMVCEWGMSAALGPLAFGKREEQIFLGREINRTKDYSEKTAEIIDAEVKRIVTENYQRAKALLESRMDVLHRLAETLLEHEALDGEQIDAVIEGRPLPRPARTAAGGAPRDREKGKAPKPIFAPPSLAPLKEDPEKA